MSGAFGRMWSKLPDTLKSESIRKYYTALGEIFDYVEERQKPYIYTEVLDELSGDMLDLYGSSYGVYRNQLIDEAYKRKIKIEQFKADFVPTLNNFIEAVRFITGYEVECTEGWKLSPAKKALLKLLITIPAGSDTDLLFDLDKLYSAGIKIEWETRQESFIPYELIGEHNLTGIKNLYKDKTRVLDETKRIRRGNHK